MAGKLIAHLAAWYIPTGRTDLDGMEGLTVDGGYLLEARRMHTELEARARGQPLMVEIEIMPVRDKRTLDQNRLMWALLNKLAQALSGGTPGGVTAEQCYLDLLADYGAEVETWRVPLKALPGRRRRRDNRAVPGLEACGWLRAFCRRIKSATSAAGSTTCARCAGWKSTTFCLDVGGGS